MSQVVLAGSIRTPIGAFLGTLSDISTVDLGTICAQESIRRANVPVDEIDEVILGHVLAASQGKSVRFEKIFPTISRLSFIIELSMKEIVYSESKESSSGKGRTGGGSVLKYFSKSIQKSSLTNLNESKFRGSGSGGTMWSRVSSSVVSCVT